MLHFIWPHYRNGSRLYSRKLTHTSNVNFKALKLNSFLKIFEIFVGSSNSLLGRSSRSISPRAVSRSSPWADRRLSWKSAPFFFLFLSLLFLLPLMPIFDRSHLTFWCRLPLSRVQGVRRGVQTYMGILFQNAKTRPTDLVASNCVIAHTYRQQRIFL